MSKKQQAQQDVGSFFDGMAPQYTPEAGALALRNEIATLQAELDNFTGMDDLTSQDFVIPWVKIVQPLTRDEGAVEGNFYRVALNENAPVLDVIMVSVKKGRSLWEKGKFDAPICKSLNGLTPAPEFMGKFSTICKTKDGVAVCPKAQWVNRRCECDETYTVLCIDLDPDMMQPFLMTISGTSIKPLRKVFSSFKMRGQGRMYLFNVTLGLEKRSDESGKYYVLKPGPPVLRYERDLKTAKDPESEEELLRLIQACRQIDMQRAMDAEEANAAHRPDPTTTATVNDADVVDVGGDAPAVATNGIDWLEDGASA